MCNTKEYNAYNPDVFAADFCFFPFLNFDF
jgi:hypothetical protein